ncbi:hypothetical protein NMG46_22620 [Mesorhizobium sp. LMG 17147]|uniref:hypothetical protein n=1 Tax=Mesorhizobium sp. LMG 17147 TaxID=2963091 RepID=UPI0020C95D61|nr:hypothetical protein [Mesorhizobium sp. LMG 17147]MCP9233006.1 hypothetical protein [Mesorhizobium sp. LMG 17147]
MTDRGATTTSSLIAGKVCFQEAAKPTSTADIGREAAILLQPSSNVALLAK